MNWAKTLFVQHKNNAARRRILFEFTFEDWVDWWELNLGADWMSLRGCKKGHYVMARKGDRGGYTEANVRCILHSENVAETVENGTSAPGIGAGHARLNVKAVRAIFLSTEPYKVLRARYAVSDMAICDIRAGRTWRKETSDLVRPSRIWRNQWNVGQAIDQVGTASIRLGIEAASL